MPFDGRKNPCLPCMLLAGNPARARVTRLPDPGDLARLGSVREIRVRRDRDGEDEIHRFGDEFEEGPPLYWSPKLRVLLVFPRLRSRRIADLTRLNPARAERLFRQAGTDRAAKLFRRWSIHEPTELARIHPRDYPLRSHGRALRIVYASPKFSRVKETEGYYHPFHREDRIAVCPGSAGGPPQAIAIWGPKLTVTERGIVN